jgi:hypothetical protein
VARLGCSHGGGRRSGDGGLAFSRRKEKGGRGPHGSERRGWRRVGLAGGQVLVGSEAGGWAWEKEAAQERRRGSRPGRRERSGSGKGDGERASRRPRPRWLVGWA